MSNKLAVLILFLLVSFFIKAQSFGGGAIAGISTSQVGGDNLSGFNKAGLLIGVYANRLISDLISFQMELTYIQKGSNNPKMNDANHSSFLKEDISMEYAEVPFIIQYHQSQKIKIEGGAYFSSLINAYYNDLNGQIPSSSSVFIKYDIGLIIGIDYIYSEKISLNSRISNSIIPLGTEDYNNSNTFNSKLKGKYNSVLSFALHYNL